MGIPSKKLKMGGPTTHLPFLVDYFNKNEQFKIRTFDYGSKVDGGSLVHQKEGHVRKVINTIQVFIIFIYQIATYRPQIVHINTAFDRRSLLRDLPFSIFCYLFGQRLIFKLHGSSDLINTKSSVYRFLIRLFFVGAKKIGVLSEIEKTQFVLKFGNVHKLEVVKNIVNLNEVKRCTFFAKNTNKTYILFVSRIVKGKGLDDLIAALKIILEINPAYILVVAGDGPELASSRRLAQDLLVDESIIWLGLIPHDEIASLIQSADIFIFPSHFPEGMPMALVEALRCGIPLITTRVRFALNYLIENSNCLFIDAGNIDDISEKIIVLVNDTLIQDKMRRQNPELVVRFSASAVGFEFQELYKQMIQTSQN